MTGTANAMCASKAAYARPYWDAATWSGKPNATTTFHHMYNKHDYRYLYGRFGEFVRQDGDRGMALGYLTKVRFVRFLSSPMATDLTGLDLTRPGQNAEQAARIIVVAERFFKMLVMHSHHYPYRDDDYGNVMRSRNLPYGSFCIFTGFSEALSSFEMQKLREEWKTTYLNASPPPLATPPAPAPLPASEPMLAPAPPPTPEAVSASEPAPEPSPPPPSAPAPTPAPAPRSASSTCPAIDDDERLEKFMKMVLSASRSCTYNGEEEKFGASGFRKQYDEPLFFVQRNYSPRRSNCGYVRVTMVLKSPLRKRLRVRALHSKEEIGAAFASLRGSNN